MKKKFYVSPVTDDVLVFPMGLLMGSNEGDNPQGDPENPYGAPRKPF